MSAKQQNLTPEKKYEMELKLEAELSQTMRQQRILDREISFYQSGVQRGPESSILKILGREYCEILTDSYVACSKSKEREIDGIISSIVSLIDDRVVLAKNVKGKEKQLLELDESISEVMKNVDEMKHKVPSELHHVERCLAGQKQLEVLESKLDTVIKEGCTVMTTNRLLREEIDHMLIERLSFNKMFYGYLKNLSMGKKLMMDIIEQATIAYDQRDEWITRLNALRNRAVLDFKMHTMEMTNLRKKLDNDQALEEFMAVKGQFRNMVHLEEKTIKQRERKRAHMEQYLVNYRNIINEIRDYTKVDPQREPVKIMQYYIDLEELNMSVFNFINELQAEMEVNTDKVINKHQLIERQMEISQGYAVQQKEDLKLLKSRLVESKKEADEAKRSLNGTKSTLKGLYNGIGRLFQICKCSKSPFIQLLHDFSQVDDYNVFCFLEVLESTISSLLSNVYFKQSTVKNLKPEQEVIDRSVRAPPAATITEVTPTNPCPLCVDRELVSDVIDSLQYVLTRDEVVEKLSLRLALPDGLERLHNVSACHLPKSRQIIQKRLQ